MDEASFGRVVDRLRAAGYRHAWRRQTGGDEILILVLPEEYDLVPTQELEAELIRLSGLKVWVTYWRSEPVLSQMLF